MLETAWLSNRAHAATLLDPAPRRFVYAKHLKIPAARTSTVIVNPNKQGRKLIAHHRYAVTIRLWVTYTPTNGTQRKIGLRGLTSPANTTTTTAKQPRSRRPTRGRPTTPEPRSPTALTQRAPSRHPTQRTVSKSVRADPSSAAEIKPSLLLARFFGLSPGMNAAI